jgi:hypothetical protein
MVWDTSPIIEKILLPRKFWNADVKEKYKTINFLYFSHFIILVLTIIFLLLLLLFSSPYSPIIQEFFQVNNFTDVETINLTTAQISKINNHMSQLKPEYLKKQDKIIFVRDLENHCYGGNSCEGLGGYNLGKGSKIVIEYTNYDYEMKMRICHELLHTYMDLGDITHEVVYDLGYQLPCFKKINQRIGLVD